jgi:hypothetical protein
MGSNGTRVGARVTPARGETSALGRVLDRLRSATNRVRPGRFDASANSKIDELFEMLSARITADAVRQNSQDWPGYFNEVRIMILRVVAETDESRLSARERIELTKRLVDHVEALEKLWSLSQDRDNSTS